MKRRIFYEAIKEWYELDFNDLLHCLEYNLDLYIALKESFTGNEFEEVLHLIEDFRQIENVTEPTYDLFCNRMKTLQEKFLNDFA
jgi:hypothetical protein